MQNKLLSNEINNNNNNIFVSKELESRLSDQIVIDNTDCVLVTNDKIIKGSVLSQKESLDKCTFTIDVGKENITGINMGSLKGLSINNLKEIDLKSNLKKFHIYLNSNGSYHIKLKLLFEKFIDDIEKKEENK